MTGGVGGAEDGSLTVMVGGDEDAYREMAPVLESLGSTIVHVGPNGHGQVAKLVNQMLMSALYCSVAEAFAFAAQLGVDVGRVYAVVESGGGRSAILSRMGRRIVEGRHSRPSGHGNLGQHGKDVGYVVDEARRHHIYIPVAAAVHEVWKLAVQKGFGEFASTDIVLLWEDSLGKPFLGAGEDRDR